MKLLIPLLILMSLWITEAVAQKPAPGPPTGVTVTPGDRQYTLRWTHPSGISTDDIDAYYIAFYASVGDTTERSSNILWSNSELTVVESNPYYIWDFQINGIESIFRMRVKMKSNKGYNDRDGAWSPYLKVTPMMPAPMDFTATLDAPTTGSRTVTLRWTAIPQLPFNATNRDVTDYEYSQNGGT